jgi:hypothetical protein
MHMRDIGEEMVLDLVVEPAGEPRDDLALGREVGRGEQLVHRSRPCSMRARNFFVAIHCSS